jgi:hypothetical protein
MPGFAPGWIVPASKSSCHISVSSAFCVTYGTGSSWPALAGRHVFQIGDWRTVQKVAQPLRGIARRSYWKCAVGRLSSSSRREWSLLGASKIATPDSLNLPVLWLPREGQRYLKFDMTDLGLASLRLEMSLTSCPGCRFWPPGVCCQFMVSRVCCAVGDPCAMSLHFLLFHPSCSWLGAVREKGPSLDQPGLFPELAFSRAVAPFRIHLQSAPSLLNCLISSIQSSVKTKERDCRRPLIEHKHDVVVRLAW